MAYKLKSTKQADEMLDGLIMYLVVNLKNNDAAIRLLNGYEKLYDRMKENPYQFPLSTDMYFAGMGIRHALVSGMNYMLLFELTGEDIVILGYYHQSENYIDKLV